VVLSLERGIDLETLAGIIGITGIIFLLLSVTPLELIFREYMLERVSVRAYSRIRRVLFYVSVAMAVVGLVMAYYCR
jgi:hypothetical protein